MGLGYQDTLISSQIDGTQILNSSAGPVSIIPPAAKYALPANFFYIGKVLKISAQGRISNVATTPGTILFVVVFGGSITVYNSSSATIALNTTVKTDVAWNLDIVLTCRSIGNATQATLMGQGMFTSESVLGGTNTNAATTMMIPVSAPAVGNGFDSTIAQTVDLQAKFSVATATTALTCHQYRLENLN